ncbi:MAG: hypothetical protein LBQ81_07730 [Zoogloeaceae bacterium]|jgi:hypothetical protein|nr:hypothetical protein [Zoogloeaceae bacterium]
MVASALVNKGKTLEERRQFDDAITTYEALERRFGKDCEPDDIRELVASALQRAAHLRKQASWQTVKQPCNRQPREDDLHTE